MTSIIFKNEQVKRNFYKYLEHQKGFSPKSVQCYENAIWLWEDFSNKEDFSNFNQTKAQEYVVWLKNKVKKNSQIKVSLSYCYDNLRYLKVFFSWLHKQSGYKSKINEVAPEYLNLTRGEVRIATQPKGRQSPTVEDIKIVIENIKGKSEIQMRDKALISLMFLTGARISAISTLPMRSFDREKLRIDQDPKLGVKTKNSKRIPTALIPLFYSETLNYFVEWFDYLKQTKNFQPNDPIFPATKRENGKENLGYYSSDEVEAIFWKSTTTVRKIFEKCFKDAGVRYYHPHTFRHLLVKEISKLPLTEEQKKAISQNLGHENVGTTFGSYGYGKIDEERQMEIIKNISPNNKPKEMINQFSNEELLETLKQRIK